MRIKWLWEECFIPGHGSIDTDDVVDMDDVLAKDFVKRKKAKEVKSKVKEVNNELRSES